MAPTAAATRGVDADVFCAVDAAVVAAADDEDDDEELMLLDDNDMEAVEDDDMALVLLLLLLLAVALAALSATWYALRLPGAPACNKLASVTGEKLSLLLA